MEWLDDILFLLVVAIVIAVVAPRVARWADRIDPSGLTFDDLLVENDDAAAKLFFNW